MINFEVFAPGIKPIMTVDPENIKAILATQFTDFGKGEEFHKGWAFVWPPVPCKYSYLVPW